MTPQTELALRALAHHFGLTIEYVSNMPSGLRGFLSPIEAPDTIVVDATSSRSEQAFTIVHELAHYILHYERSHRTRLPSFLTQQWKSERMIRLSRIFNRFVSRELNREWQADGWAFCALLQIGATDDIAEILKLHPEKTGICCLCVIGSIYEGIKSRFKIARSID